MTRSYFFQFKIQFFGYRLIIGFKIYTSLHNIEIFFFCKIGVVGNIVKLSLYNIIAFS